MTSPNKHSTEERTSLIAELYNCMPAFEELTLDCEMVPANGSSRDRQGPHRCTLASHEDRKQTSVNSVEAGNPEAFQHHAFFLLGKIEKYHVNYLQIICQYLVNN